MSIQKNVKKRVAEFIIENKNVPNEWRAELVRKFTDEIMQEVTDLGGHHAIFMTWKMRHPRLIRKGDAPLYTIADILADFIMNAKAVAERSAEYPVLNAEKEYRVEKKRSGEALIETEMPGEDEWTYVGVAYEEQFNKDNPVEAALFGDELDVTVSGLMTELSAIKKKPEPFIKQYADGSDWNREDSTKKRTPFNVRTAIEQINVDRVRSCIVCASAFYAHSSRQKICNVMVHPKQRDVSYCQYERDKELAIIRKHRNKAS